MLMCFKQLTSNRKLLPTTRKQLPTTRGDVVREIFNLCILRICYVILIFSSYELLWHILISFTKQYSCFHYILICYLINQAYKINFKYNNKTTFTKYNKTLYVKFKSNDNLKFCIFFKV